VFLVYPSRFNLSADGVGMTGAAGNLTGAAGNSQPKVDPKSDRGGQF
jgi:hypothetical protein